MRKSIAALTAGALCLVLPLAFGQTPPTPKLASTSSATLTNPPSTSMSTNVFPAMTVQKKLEAGETMTATLTATAPATPTMPQEDFTIMNPPLVDGTRTTPTWSGTRAAGTQGVAFVVPGIVNGFNVSDIHINGKSTYVRPNFNFKTGYLTIAAFQDNGAGGLKAGAPGSWLADHGFVDPIMLGVPEFFTSDIDLHVGVDLAIWGQHGFVMADALVGEDYAIVNGVADLLPGFVFSPDPLSMDDGGWAPSARFTGAATLFSHTLVAAVPEPGSIALALLGLGLLPIRQLRMRTQARGSVTPL